jgi:tetratricopeptide (TPR) repeat protein
MANLATLQSRAQAIGVLIQEQRFEEADVLCRELVTEYPRNGSVRRILGVIVRHRGLLAESLEHLQEASRLAPSEGVTWYELGVTHIELKNPQAAIVAFRNAVAHDPTIQEAHLNLNALLENLGEHEEAKRFGENAIAMRPDCAISHYNMGNVSRALGDLPTAIRYYRRATELRPNYHTALSNLSIALLTDGQYDEGFHLYEYRTLSGEVALDKHTQPLWKGEPLVGKTLLIHAEQGIGDEIMFASCLPDLIAQAKKCILVCEPRLEVLFRRSFPQAAIYGYIRRREFDPYPVQEPVDYQIPAGSVPRYLRRDLADFPRRDSFLQADAGQVRYWRKKYESLGPGVRIGVSWRAGGKPAERRKRTTSLVDWQELLTLPGIQWVNLQYGDSAEELREVRETLGVTVHDFPEGDSLVDMDAFAAKMLGLDLVVSCGNATVHLAGALGMPVWAMLPFMPAWRWLFQGETSPWYPSVKLFRQGKNESFAPTLARLAQALRERYGIQSEPLPTRRSVENSAAKAIDCLRDTSEAGFDEQSEQARIAFNAGDKIAAEQTCRRILHHAPRHPGALRILAMIAVQTGRTELAVQSLRRAISIEPENPRNWAWLGESLLRNGELAEAESALLKALELNPSSGRACVTLAQVYLADGNVSSAQQVLEKIGGDNSQNTDYLVAQGRLLVHTCRVDAAMEVFRKALEIDPDHLESLLELTSLLAEDCDFTAAETLCRRGIEKHPLAAELHHWLGRVLVLSGQLTAALQPLRTALTLAPENAQRLALLGETMLLCGKAREAREVLARAAEIGPPHWTYLHALAQTEVECADFTAAEAALTNAIELASQEHVPRYQRALVRLPQGKYAAGWDDYESRFGAAGGGITRCVSSAPIWHGESLTGKQILIVGEQGLGDEIMFATCLPDVLAQASGAVVLCDRRLASIFTRSFPGGTFIGVSRGREHLASLPSGFKPDVQVMLGSLPRFLRRAESDFPRQTSFLQADETLTDTWWQRLTELGPGLKVGLALRGGTSQLDRRTRWTQMSDWQTLLSVPGVHWINLQHDVSPAELATLQKMQPSFHHYADWTKADSLESLLALVANLDLVISVGNTNTHLAGSLGIPAWTLLQANSGWRWPLTGVSAPWYESVRLYRTVGQDSWDVLFKRVREDILKRTVAPRR